MLKATDHQYCAGDPWLCRDKVHDNLRCLNLPLFSVRSQTFSPSAARASVARREQGVTGPIGQPLQSIKRCYFNNSTSAESAEFTSQA